MLSHCFSNPASPRHECVLLLHVEPPFLCIVVFMVSTDFKTHGHVMCVCVCGMERAHTCTQAQHTSTTHKHITQHALLIVFGSHADGLHIKGDFARSLDDVSNQMGEICELRGILGKALVDIQVVLYGGMQESINE